MSKGNSLELLQTVPLQQDALEKIPRGAEIEPSQAPGAKITYASWKPEMTSWAWIKMHVTCKTKILP